ncbi:hypothetical protein HNQ96_003837 [Aminobacter lissarensis]|uniref:Uncharacterized protein n=1 Tax=Aminobacter carboxidus TaxID=376165 RepID=A0A8E1WHE9_9HYPH|nr:hypothetical protein [Aminobacter lissarensis]MBB6467954.1 hypothetical protein [Aminobacter lissarensis]
MQIPPWTILAGIGGLERRGLADLLANLEATTLWAMSKDRFWDLLNRIQNGTGDPEATSFARRLHDLSDEVFTSEASSKSLRLRLWVQIMQALDLDPRFPLSFRTANAICASLANAAASVIAQRLPEAVSEAEGTVGQSIIRRVQAVAKRSPTADFESLVAEKARTFADTLANAARTGELKADDAAEIERRVRAYIDTLPPEAQDAAVRDALKRGDNAALLLAVSGTSALAVGVGVNLAGFSAYILAAQASAIIPLVGGPAAVSTLFMLANPLFTIPAVTGLAYLANRHVTATSARHLAANVILHLSLRGLSSGPIGLGSALNQFRAASPAESGNLPATVRDKYLDTIASISKRVGGHLPLAPGEFPDAWDSRKLERYFQGAVSASHGDNVEVAAVGTLTAADIIYNAASIDPLVIAAADFSRVEEITDIFELGYLADRIGSMSGKAAAGAGNNLRGYVSEQIVAARLVENGYVVELPDTSNNPGFDLLVDGNPFQVKCLLGLDGLREHFSKYPDMPVYANKELAEAVLSSGEAWASKVYYVDGFEREIADLVMLTSLEAGEALGDLNVPYFAMAASTARNLHRWWRGSIPLSDLPLSILIDNTVKGGLATVGGLSGKTVGLLAFGPAGALVLGSVGGIGALFGAGWAREQTTRLLSSEWLQALDEATERFRSALSVAIQVKINLLRKKRAKLPINEHPLRTWIDARFSDDIVSVCEAAHKLDASMTELRQPSRAKACLEIMREAKVHPIAVENEMTSLLAVLASEPSKTQAAGRKAIQKWTALKSMLPGGPRGDI